MEDLKNEKLLDEMTAFISENADVTSGADDDGLPFEPFDAFSTDPVEFEEMAERMLTKVENIFDLTRIYNRHSSGYLKAFALLERGIRQLGSVCITKAALREHNTALPELGQLTTQKLYRMASFNYRKLDTALTENLQKRNDLYPELTDAFFRCFSLLQRLRATERKIYNYFSNMYYRQENYAPAIEGFAFSPKSWSKSYISNKEEAPAFRSAPAYPVIQDSGLGIQDPGKRGAQSGDGKLRIKNEELKIQNSKKSSAETKDQLRIKNEGSKAKNCRSLKAQTETAGLPAPKDKPEEDHDTAKDPELSETPAAAEKSKGETRTADPEKQAVTGEPGPVGGGPSDTKIPACLEIVQRAKERSAKTGNGSIAFTNPEVLALAADPRLDFFFPKIAPWVRQTAAKISPGPVNSGP